MPKSRKRKSKKGPAPKPTSQPLWMEDDGMHVLIPDEGQAPDLDTLSQTFQDKIRHSSLWETMVAEFGTEKAERVLKEFKVELKR